MVRGSLYVYRNILCIAACLVAVIRASRCHHTTFIVLAMLFRVGWLFMEYFFINA